MPRRAHPQTRVRSKSRSKGSKASPNGTEEYSCTLYQDYLVFVGGIEGTRMFNDPVLYNLKEKRLEENIESLGNASLVRFSHAACVYEKENSIIFYGGEGTDREQERTMASEIQKNSKLIIKQNHHGIFHLIVEPGISGVILPSPVATIHEDKLYLYQSDETHGNFGSLYSYDLSIERWHEYDADHGDMKLYEPGQNAIFSGDKLYLFVEKMDHSLRTRSIEEQDLEDVYVMDLGEKNLERPKWRKVSSGDQQVPGTLTNISMAEADGIIYVFGSSYERPVLWTYDTNGETWSRVKGIGEFIVGPNQRAIVYKDQLLIVNWSYLNQVVEIQYLSLDGLEITGRNRKKLCKDQPENFIKDAKSLFNGGLFPDIIFEVEGEEISAHKAILAYRSDYFMRMFTSGMSESHSTKIPIPHIKSHIFKAVLQYIYCNELELDEQLALDLIPIVDEYLMKGLKGLCEKYLCKQLRKDNVVDMLIVADRHEIEELKKACFRFILKNLGSIDENEEMMKLSKQLFLELLKFSRNEASSKNQEKGSDDTGFTNGLGQPLRSQRRRSLRRRSRSRS